MHNITAEEIKNGFIAEQAGNVASHVVFVLDNSTSMQSCRDAMISSYNEFLETQLRDADDTGIETLVSLYKFDGRSIETVFRRQDVHTVEKLNHETYKPNGMTNLVDAIGSVIDELNDEFKNKNVIERDSVIITILTDGAENASKKYTSSMIKEMVKACENSNWGFMFLGANIDAFATSKLYGFSENTTLQYDTDNMRETLDAATRSVSSMKSAYATGLATAQVYNVSGFTDEERTKATKK